MLMRRIVRFCLTGIFVTLVHVVVATAWIRGVHPEPGFANSVAYVLATAVSYVINTRWSFSSAMERLVLAKFLVVAMLGLVLAAGVSHAVDALGLPYPYGIAAVVCVMPPFNFLMHHFWTYRLSRIDSRLSSTF